MQATPARTYDEVIAAKIMIARGTEETLGLKPDRLAPIPHMGRASFSVGWLATTSHRTFRCGTRASAKTEPSHEATSRSTRNATSASVLPANCSLRRGRLAPTTRSDIWHLNATATHVRSSHNCPNTPSRKVMRDVDDTARALMGTPEFDKSRDERKKVEMRSAHLKTMALNACACGAFLVLATSSTSQPSYRT